MKTNLLLIIIAALLFTHPAYSQLDDVFGKVKKEIEKYIDTTSTPKKEKKTKKTDTTSVAVKKDFSIVEMKFTNEKKPELNKRTPQYSGGHNFRDNITACVMLKQNFGEYPVYDSPEQTVPAVQQYPTGDYYLKTYIDNTVSDIVHTGSFPVDVIYGNSCTTILYCNECTGDAESIEKLLNDLPGGKHTVKIEMWKGIPGGLSGKEPVAAGEFTLYKPVLKTFSQIPAGMNNGKLELDAIEAINRYAAAEGWKERYYKAVINSYDWYISRNEWTSIIKGRSLEVTLLGKWPDGSCRFAEFSVWQSYDGSRYSDVMQYNGIGSMYDSECE